MISIILPIYNAEKYLDRCINSISGQTYSDVELILVNDGSTDGSADIIKRWEGKDKRIKTIQQKNAGVSAARNQGLMNAQGEFIMFVDSDDYMFPEMCRIMYEAMLEKDADCIISGTTETGGNYWRPQENKDYNSLQALKNDFVEQLQTELLSPPWNKIYKKNKITSFFPTEISFGEDLIFNLQYLKNCERISFITEAPFYHEKDNIDSLVVKIDKNRLIDIEQVLDAVLSFYDNKDKLFIYDKYLSDLSVHSKRLLNCTTIKWVEKKRILKNWRSNSHLKNLPIWKMKRCRWQNKLLLLLLKRRCWLLSLLLLCRERMLNLFWI